MGIVVVQKLLNVSTAVVNLFIDARIRQGAIAAQGLERAQADM